MCAQKWLFLRHQHFQNIFLIVGQRLEVLFWSIMACKKDANAAKVTEHMRRRSSYQPFFV